MPTVVMKNGKPLIIDIGDPIVPELVPALLADGGNPCDCCCGDCDTLEPYDEHTHGPTMTVSVPEVTDGGNTAWVSVSLSSLPAPDTAYGDDLTIQAATMEVAFQGFVYTSESTDIAQKLWDRAYDNGDTLDNVFREGEYPRTCAGSTSRVRNLSSCVQHPAAGLSCRDVEWMEVGQAEFKITIGPDPSHVIVVASRVRSLLSNGCSVYGDYQYRIIKREPCGPPDTDASYTYAYVPNPSSPSLLPLYYYNGSSGSEPAGAPITHEEERHNAYVALDVTANFLIVGSEGPVPSPATSFNLPYDSSTFLTTYTYQFDGVDEQVVASGLHATDPVWLGSEFYQYRYAYAHFGIATLTLGSVSTTLFEWGQNSIDGTVSVVLARGTAVETSNVACDGTPTMGAYAPWVTLASGDSHADAFSFDCDTGGSGVAADSQALCEHTGVVDNVRAIPPFPCIDDWDNVRAAIDFDEPFFTVGGI